MAKNNLTSKPLVFDELVGDSPADTARRVFDFVEAHAQEARGWYWKSIRSKRFGSLVVRVAAYGAAVGGSIAPVIAGVRDTPAERLVVTQFGVACLVLAGVVLLADRLFGWSSGWLRYVSTVLAMERSTRQFRMEWIAYLLPRKQETLTLEDVKALFEVARRFHQEIDSRVKEETEGWVAEFNSGMAALDQMLRVQREATEKAAHLAREATEASLIAARPGAVEVHVAQSRTPLRPVALVLTSNEAGRSEATFTGPCWAKTDLPPGLYTVHVVLGDGTPERVEATRAVPVQGGTCTKVELTL